MRARLLAAIIGLGALGAAPAWAQPLVAPSVAPSAAPTTPPLPDPFGTLSLAIENDKFGGTDRNYSNGLQLSWRSPSADLPAPLAWLDRQLDFIQGPGALRWGLTLGHAIYTPTDTQARFPDPTDRPYAGYLFSAASLSRTTAESLSVLELQVGLVGPSAGGKFVQNNFHSLIGVETAKGWDSQLRDEPVVNLVLERKRRVELGSVGGLFIEALPSGTISLGNGETYAGLGGILRIGQTLEADFGPPRIRPALAGSAHFQPQSDDFGWYLFTGAEGRGVARDIFLDGNTWRDGPSVDKRPLVADFQAGAAVIWKGMRLTYTHVLRTDEFYAQKGGMQQFGSVSLSFRF